MAIFRTLLAAAFLIAIVGLPALVPRGDPDSGGLAVSAAPADSPSFDNHNDNGNGNNNFNNNFNNNSNANRNDNDDDDDNNNGDDDENGNDDDDDNDNLDVAPLPPPGPPPPPRAVDRCYAAGEVGALSLILDGGSVTLDVVPVSSFGRVSRVTLSRVDPASVPATPGPRLDEIVFELRAQDGCDGGLLGELPSDANLGVAYHVPADKSTLRFAVWDGSRWVDVPTVPDPNPGNPYVSATIRRTGLYVLYQAR